MIAEEDFSAGNTIVNTKTAESPDNEIAFLKDVQEYPESGIAARYKRLGLSVRQGQKLIAKLAEQGLIGEHEEITKTGRIKFVCLTPKGKGTLSRANSG